MNPIVKSETYNGVPVCAGWGAAALAEQRRAQVVFPDGTTQPRIRWGEEAPAWPGIICHDCAVRKGNLHVFGCDVERCPRCQGQLIACDCHATTTIATTLGYVLKERREARGLPLLEVELATGLSSIYLELLEGDRIRHPVSWALSRLLTFYQVDPTPWVTKVG